MVLTGMFMMAYNVWKTVAGSNKAADDAIPAAAH
jgi:cbb3-type cytochrome oxidase subunit 1